MKILIKALQENGKPVMMPRMMTIPGLEDVPTYRKLQTGEPVEVEPEIAEYLILNHFCETVGNEIFEAEKDEEGK